MRIRKEEKKKLYYMYVELLCRNVLLGYIIIPKDMGIGHCPYTNDTAMSKHITGKDVEVQ